MEEEIYNNKSRFIKFLERDEREVIMKEDIDNKRNVRRISRSMLINPLSLNRKKLNHGISDHG